MAKVQIIDSLAKENQKRFKDKSHKIISLLESLEENPHKGKPGEKAGGIEIKGLKYKKFRFYFIVDGQKLRIYSKEGLTDLLMKFVRMSDKKTQQKTIKEIREILIKIGKESFE